MIDRSRRGFTLIELMIVVAIIAILATIAYPSYVDYVIRSNRSAAQQFILDVAQRQEQYLMDNRRYATALGSGTGELNLTVPTDVASKYTVTLAAPTAITYTITAIPITGTVQAIDGTLTLDQAGVKKRVVNGVDKGWK